MKNFKEEFYKVLLNRENFYMRQYYSDFHKKEIFIAIKELKDGIYCVLISNQENENVDYLESIEYIKTLGKSFSLNLIILSNNEYAYTNHMDMANRLIVDNKEYKVIECDESCRPLRHIFERFLKENKVKATHNNGKFLKYKVPTLSIILINVIIFIITQIFIYSITNEIQPTSQDMVNAINNSVLIRFGAKYNPLIASGEIWRLLTCAFLHSSLMHIGFNMYSLYIIGPQINQIYGTKRYLIIYIISCITSSTLSYFMSPSISVGASGGIFGLMGALLTFTIIERHKIEKRSIYSLLQVIAINLFIGLTVSNIDNFAHIGGLLGGMLVGYITYKILILS